MVSRHHIEWMESQDEYDVCGAQSLVTFNWLMSVGATLLQVIGSTLVQVMPEDFTPTNAD